MAVLALVAAAGCQPEKAPEALPGNSAANGQPSDPTQSAQSDAERTGKKLKQYAEEAKPNEKLYAIKDPGTGGWEPEVSVPEKQNVGDIIDSGLAKLDPAYADVKVEFSNGGDLLRISPQFRFQDRKHFNIEYGLPETEGDLNRLLADGKERALWEGEKLKPLPPFDQNAPAPKFDRAGIEKFVRRMPIDGFMYFQTGAPVWGSLVRALEDPANGFKTTTEEQKFTVNKIERSFYRVVASSVTGPKTELEVLVDTRKNVPVTFRSTQVGKDGKERKLWWTADWGFHGKHDPNIFVIPKKS